MAYRSYIGYYNYYNIGASSSTTISPVEKGLQYAKNKGWISPILAIDGGAEYIAQSYIKKGQNTVYYERFNTAVKPYYEHQYMTNLTGATSRRMLHISPISLWGFWITDMCFTFRYIRVCLHSPLK